MSNRLIGMDCRPEVPEPTAIRQELYIAQTWTDNLRRALRLSETIYAASVAKDDRQRAGQ